MLTIERGEQCNLIGEYIGNGSAAACVASWIITLAKTMG